MCSLFCTSWLADWALLVPPSLTCLVTFPQVKEAVLPRPLLTFLLGKEAVSPRQLLTLLLRKEAILPRLLLTFPLREGNSSPQAGQSSNQARSGKALGGLSGIGHPRLPRRMALSPGKTTPPLPPPVGFLKGLLMNLTLSGSLTFPTNQWPQLKGLFWLKDPTLWLPQGNLLTYSISLP